MTARLDEAGIPYELCGLSALDRYFGRAAGPNTYAVTAAGLVDLARSFPDLAYPRIDRFDGALHRDGESVYLRCIDDPGEAAPVAFPVLDFYYSPARDAYRDPRDVYGILRSNPLPSPSRDATVLGALVDAARLVSRYHYETPSTAGGDGLPAVERFPSLPAELQRMILTDILTGLFPWKGMGLLKEAGFVDAYWPELAGMDTTGHSKEHHPEGNVWEHSLETFRYRKTTDLTLTLGLLLHDCGKPVAKPTRERRFDKHAEIGAAMACRFLRRLEFPEGQVDQVHYLVKNHMFPGALEELPIHRTQRIMADPLFPLMLELYRCDLSSTYRGPEGYYRACRIYRRFLKHSGNPFRAADGRKLVKLYVE